MVGKLTPDNMLSASVIPVVLNASPYKTQNELLAEFIDRDEGRPPEPWEGNELTRWGDIHEGAILTEAAKRLRLTGVVTVLQEALHHDTLPLACSLDGFGTGSCVVASDIDNGIYVMAPGPATLDGEMVLLEAKSTQAAPEDEPPHHRGVLQLQAQMMCAGAKWGAVCVLYRGSTLRIFIYPADPAVQSRIAHAVHEFEQRRRDKDWYPVLTSDDGNVAFARVDDGAPPLDVKDPDVQESIDILVEAKRVKKEAEQSIDQAEAVIKEYMGNHEEARTDVDGQTVIIKWPMRNMKARPERVTPAKPAQKIRQSSLTVKVLD